MTKRNICGHTIVYEKMNNSTIYTFYKNDVFISCFFQKRRFTMALRLYIEELKSKSKSMNCLKNRLSKVVYEDKECKVAVRRGWVLVSKTFKFKINYLFDCKEKQQAFKKNGIWFVIINGVYYFSEETEGEE